MSSPVKLATPYPTMEEAAEVYGISSSRLERLKKMVAGLLPQRRNKAAAPPSTPVRISARKAKTTKVRSRANESSQHAHTKNRAAGTK
jgi:hypothetical protein